ncbi:hypothetical protein ACF0H5_005982 [Mactra antiquata]
MAKFRLLMDVLFTLCLLLDFSGCFKLDDRCFYFREDVRCLHANLTYIPEIPNNVSGLIFSDNYLPHVTSDTFTNISDPKKFTYLRLAYDHIKTIKNDSLESFTGLNYLSLTGNHIEATSLMYLLGVLCHVELKAVILNAMGSSIRSLQTFSLMDNCEIKELHMERNAFVYITRGIVQHIYNVKELNLRRNRIELFQLSYMKNLEILKLSYNELTNVPNFCMENKTSASMVPKIRELFINYNSITNINPKSFECLTSLKELRLDDKAELLKLALGENSLESINDHSISSKRYLKFLYLNSNKFSHLSQQTLPIEFLNQLDRIDFADNPFLCDCALEWFIEWLKTTDTKIGQADSYICAGPDRLAGKSLFDVEFTYLECHPWMWVIIIVLPSLSVILIISVLVYRNRWNIKHFIYLYRMRRIYIQIKGENYLYDAFVASSKNDSDWVTGKLLPILETEYGYKLCIHERDFGTGAYINDYIVHNINNSKSVLLVLSETFVNSDWCNFVLKVALSKRVEEDFPVIVIILQEVGYKNISLKKLLKMSTNLEWKDGGAEEDLFWDKLKGTIKK